MKYFARIINSILFVTIAIILLLFKYKVKPITRGFYCDDTSINKPYFGSTVSIWGLFVSGLIIAFICFVFGTYRKCRPRENGFEKSRYKKFLVETFMLVMIFLYGTGITLMVTNIGKYFIGRLRPHYLAACQPDWLNINCTNTIGEKILLYENDVCRNTNLKVLKESRLSFPSGHASFSGFASAFLILYLESQVELNGWELSAKYIFHALLGIAASFVSISRITDYMHHPTDVLAGFTAGAIIGISMHYSLAMFYYPSKEKDVDINSDVRVISDGELSVS